MSISKPHPSDVHIGQRIRTRRLAIGMSQEALAGALDLTFQQVQKYEKGTNRVGGSRMVQIADALAIEPAYFFEGLTGASKATHNDAGAEFMACKDGVIIARAFVQIRNPDIRSAITSFVQTLAEQRGAHFQPAE
ncbi:MAG: helix-turn-helix transcriptional regulator [Pseudomonadota bacterium]